MGFLRDVSVGKKFLTIYTTLIVLLMVIVGFAYTNMSSSVSISTTFNTSIESNYIKPAELNDSLHDLSRLISVAITKQSNEDLNKIDELSRKVLTLATQIDSNFDSSAAPRVRRAVEDASRVYENNLKALLQSNDFTRARDVFINTYQPSVAQATDMCFNFLEKQLRSMAESTLGLTDTTPMYTLLGGSAVLIVLLIIYGYISTKDIMDVLSFLVKSAEEMAHLDLSRKVRITRNDEFGSLQKSFEKLRNNIADQVGFIKSTSSTVTDNTTNIASIMNNQRVSASQAESSSLTVAAAADEMVSTTADIARNCEMAASFSETTRDITSSGMESVRLAVMRIKEQAQQTKHDAELVGSLANKCQDISLIAETINEIAGQTNLLALNAAIEAARAGSMGRGFAVVADEVRALASRTTKSTKEIFDMVSKIQQEASTASSSMSESVESMDTLANNATEVENVLQDIMSHVTEVNSQITQISNAAEQQTLATGEISENMQHVTSLLRNVSASTNSVTDNVNSTKDLVGDLNGRIDEFKVVA